MHSWWDDGFGLLGVGIDNVDGQIVVVGGELPSAVLFFVESYLVGEELAQDFAFVSGGGLVLVGDDDTIVPATVLRGMQTGTINGVAGDITKLLLTVEGGDLILAEERPPLVLMAVLDSVDPLD